MKKSKYFIAIIFSCILGLASCKHEMAVDQPSDIESLISTVNADINALRLNSSTTRKEIDPKNDKNPYDSYGETYRLLIQYIENGSIASPNSNTETVESYLRDNLEMFESEGISLNEVELSSISSLYGQYQDHSTVDIVNDLYSKGQISHNIKVLLLEFEKNVVEANASTYNEIAKIFENNIAQYDALPSDEYETVLKTIAMSKYENAYISDSKNNSGRRRNCGSAGLGGAIIGFLACGGPCGIFGGIFGWLGCVMS